MKDWQNFGTCEDGGVWGEHAHQKWRKNTIFKVNLHYMYLVRSFCLRRPSKSGALFVKNRGAHAACAPCKSAPAVHTFQAFNQQLCRIHSRTGFGFASGDFANAPLAVQNWNHF